MAGNLLNALKPAHGRPVTLPERCHLGFELAGNGPEVFEQP